MTQTKVKLGNPVLGAMAVLLAAALLLIGLTSSASAGSTGNKGAGTHSHGKCHKKKSHGNAKSSVKNKCKKKPKQGTKTPPATPPVVPPPVVTPPVPPVTPPAATTLAINPASFDYGSVAHGGKTGSTQAFMVTNTGGSTSGVPSASLVELHNSETEKHVAFEITANSCTAALAPGASCSISVKFAPASNAGDQMFSSRLDVTASPGSTASSVLSGIAG